MPKEITVQAGKLDKRVVIKAPPSATATQNTYGEPTGTASTVGERWASIEPLSGSEGFEANQVIARATHKITIRYMGGVTPGCMVEVGGRALHVGYILNPAEENWKLELIVGEKVNP